MMIMAEEKKKEEKAVNPDTTVKKNNKNEKQDKKAPKEIKKDKPAKAERKVTIDRSIEPFDTLDFVLMTEKCVRLIESQNKLVFVVRRAARKKQIRKAVENAFQSPVSHVTTMIDQKGRKRAFVKFGQAGAAGDIAIKLGII